MVDGDVVRRSDFMSVERGAFLCDNRPHVRVGGRFAGEVPGLEFFECGVEVIGIEEHGVVQQLVVVDFRHLQNFDHD